MRYIKGRSNLSCIIFVPWDCNNHCKFCTSKQMYKQRTCDMDAILAQIKKINENPLIQEYVLTGGEPLADLERYQRLMDVVGGLITDILFNAVLTRMLYIGK